MICLGRGEAQQPAERRRVLRHGTALLGCGSEGVPSGPAWPGSQRRRCPSSVSKVQNQLLCSTKHLRCGLLLHVLPLKPAGGCIWTQRLIAVLARLLPHYKLNSLALGISSQPLCLHLGGEPWTREVKKPKKRKVKQARDLQEDEVTDEPVILGTGAGSGQAWIRDACSWLQADLCRRSCVLPASHDSASTYSNSKLWAEASMFAPGRLYHVSNLYCGGAAQT